MNKRADLSALTKILLILIIVVLIIIGGGRLLWDAGKSALNVFGLVNITEIDYSQLNKNAQSGFDLLIKDINACKNSQDNNCLCYPSFSDFSEIHRIDITNSEIKLVNVKDGNEITMSKENLADFNCYYKEDSAIIENPMMISFDEDLPRIEKTSLVAVPGGAVIPKSDIQFYKNPAIYKSSKTCLVSVDFDLNKVNKVCALKQ